MVRGCPRPSKATPVFVLASMAGLPASKACVNTGPPLSCNGPRRGATLRMSVPAKPVKPQRMLPVFRQMSDAFIGMSEAAVANAGGAISCRKGCAACCRQAIPLSEIEAYQIAETVEAMPEPRRTEIKMRFETAWHHFADQGWFARLDDSFKLSVEERNNVVVQFPTTTLSPSEHEKRTASL